MLYYNSVGSRNATTVSQFLFFFFQVTKKSALKSKIIRLMLPMSNPNEEVPLLFTI